jgi:hypothetical protein
MNKKNIIIVANIVFFVILGAIIYYFFAQKTPSAIPEDTTVIDTPENTYPFETPIPPEQTTETSPGSTTTNIGNEELLTIKTKSGNVPVLNFYNQPQSRIIDPQNDVMIFETSTYGGMYLTVDSSFNILITKGTLREERKKAEAEFLNKLGISQETACLLSVHVGVTRDADEYASGQNYGLSFCPNSRPMPANTGSLLENNDDER